MQKSYQVGIWELFLSFGKAVCFIPNKNEWQREFKVGGKQMEAENRETSEVRGSDWRRWEDGDSLSLAIHTVASVWFGMPQKTSSWKEGNTASELILFFLSFSGLVPCGILIPQPEIESVLREVKGLSSNHWNAREFPLILFSIPTP